MNQRDHAPFAALAGLLTLSVAAALLLSGCAAPVAEKPAPVELRVSAATSLRKVLEQTAPAFERANGVKLVFNFGASGVLQKQIEGGAPADVFMSASPKQVDGLIAAGVVSAEATSTFAVNTLVLARATNAAPIELSELDRVDLLAIGDPETTPHGALARQYLERTGVWSQLKDRVTLGVNAEQTMAHIAGNEVDAGLVFGNQLVGRTDVVAISTVPSTAIDPIRYVSAPIASSVNAELALAYLEYVGSPQVQAEFARAGFLPAPVE